MPQMPPSPDMRALLTGARDGLSFALNDAVSEDWRAVGLVLALQGALAAALLAYDTADPRDVLDLANAPRRGGSAMGTSGASVPVKLAPVPLLLRRAMSPDFLDDPERLTLSRADRRAVDDLIARRNQRLHPTVPPSPVNPSDAAAQRNTVSRILTHVLIEHPAFAVDRHWAVLADIKWLLVRMARLD